MLAPGGGGEKGHAFYRPAGTVAKLQGSRRGSVMFEDHLEAHEGPPHHKSQGDRVVVIHSRGLQLLWEGDDGVAVEPGISPVRS